MSSNQGFAGSSPSSGDADSIHGTPETRITPFSSAKAINEKTSFLLHPATGASASIKTSMTQHGKDTLDNDPFISSSIKAKCEQSLLSPTASTFQPSALRGSRGAYHSPLVVESPLPSDTIRVTKQPTGSLISAKHVDPVSEADSPISVVTQSGNFSTDIGTVSRALRVSGIYEPVVQLPKVQALVQVRFWFASQSRVSIA